MKTHQEVDRRSLAMAEAVVAKIEGDPERAGLEQARRTLKRWQRIHQGNPRMTDTLNRWQGILSLPWREIKTILTDPEDAGAELRQNSPFAGVLTPEERNTIYRRFRHDPPSI